jgi:predicted transcriptional regulator
MFVSEMMSTCVSECTEDLKLEEVYELLQKCSHGLVVVLDSMAHRVPIGVVSERSICEQIIARGRNPKSLTAGSVMDSRIKRVLASDLAETIGDISNLTAVIAIDESRRVCGLVPKEKIVRVNSVMQKAAQVMAVPAAAVQRPARKISEIPAFGWIQ